MQFKEEAKDGELYLIHLNAIDTKKVDKSNSEVTEILKEFEDVFPDDLPTELLPSREVDHKIEIIPRS